MSDEQNTAQQSVNAVSEIAAMLLPQQAPEEQEQAPEEVTTSTEQAEDVPAEVSATPTDAEPAPAPEPVTSFNELAEQAGLNMKDFYSLEVRLSGDAEPVTLGKLKDAWQDGMELEDRRVAIEQQKRDLQNEVLRNTKAINQLMGDLQLSDEQVQRAAIQFDQTKAREQEKLFQIMPELRDNPELREQQKKGMAEMLASYGVTEAEIDNIADARFTKFALDALAWKEQLGAADVNAKRVRKTAGNTAKRPRRVVSKGKQTETDKLVSKAKATGMRGDQLSAIASLLGGNS